MVRVAPPRWPSAPADFRIPGSSARARSSEEVRRRSCVTPGLARRVLFHPPSLELARWYAACDVLLMTSVFEGVPYVVYEALAMALPVVAPALPGNRELVDAESGRLIDPRDDVIAYADALAEVLGDPSQVTRDGPTMPENGCWTSSRSRAWREEHGTLYDDPARRPRSRRDRSPALSHPPPPIAAEMLLVSIVIPCFNDGGYLRHALASVADQDYAAIETDRHRRCLVGCRTRRR